LKLLFYHDPATEFGRPFFWKYFVLWAARMRRAVPGFECRFLLPDTMAEWAAMQGISATEIVSVREDHLRESCGDPPGNWNRFWFENRFTTEQADGVAAFVLQCLRGFAPDLIVAHSPVPFLRTAFPDSTLLHFESGLLKFPPFPMSFYFDPMGFFRDSYLIRNKDRLRSLTITEAQQAELESLRRLFLDDLLVAKSPFRATMNQYKERFQRRILLPLQFGNYFGFDSACRFHSQFEFARWVLERTPADVGVVMTQHIYFEQLEPEALSYLRATFPNLIYDPLFDDYNSSSQFLLGDVDAVVTVTSSVGMQSLWWRKPLIAVGASHLEAAADGDDPCQVHEIIDRGWPAWKDPFLHWLLTHYYIPESYVYSDAWLPGFLEKIRNNGGELGPIDDESRLFETIRQSAVTDIGRPSSHPARAFEILAAERLAALQEMKAEADRRGELIEQETERSKQLETALADLHETAVQRSLSIHRITAEADRRQVLLEELTAAVRDRDEKLKRWRWLLR
jgi:hypothetical protein